MVELLVVAVDELRRFGKNFSTFLTRITKLTNEKTNKNIKNNNEGTNTALKEIRLSEMELTLVKPEIISRFKYVNGTANISAKKQEKLISIKREIVNILRIVLRGKPRVMKLA